MSESLELAVFSLVALIGLGLLTANSLLRVPRWLDPNDKLEETEPDRYGDPALKANWVRLTIYSAVAGLLFGGVALILNLGFGWRQQTLVFATLGGYIFFQTLFTDFRLRNAERWGQRIANILAFATGAYILSVYGNETNWVLYLSFIAATFAIGLIPGVGNSDGRAFMFLVIATYPVASISGIQWAAIFYLAAIVLYYLGMSVYHKEFRIKGLLTKFSFPLVPLIMAPVLVTVLFGRLLPGF